MVFRLSNQLLKTVQYEYRLLLHSATDASWVNLQLGKSFFVLAGLPGGNHTLQVSAHPPWLPPFVCFALCFHASPVCPSLY